MFLASFFQMLWHWKLLWSHNGKLAINLKKRKYTKNKENCLIDARRDAHMTRNNVTLIKKKCPPPIFTENVTRSRGCTNDTRRYRRKPKKSFRRKHWLKPKSTTTERDINTFTVIWTQNKTVQFYSFTTKIH